MPARTAARPPAAPLDGEAEARAVWLRVKLGWLNRMEKALSWRATDADRAFALRILGPLVVKDLQSQEESQEEQESREMLERVMRALREGSAEG